MSVSRGALQAIDETNFNYAAFLVVDTNILLHRFEVLTQFVEDIERNGFPVIVIIPSVVVSELDGCVLLLCPLNLDCPHLVLRPYFSVRTLRIRGLRCLVFLSC